jgi:hypothetical protein
MEKLEVLPVIGLYGCYCHPFKNWHELARYNKQTIIIGANYRNRHTGVVGVAQSLHPDNKAFVYLFVEPYDCA